MTLPLIEKYCAKDLSELKGLDSAIAEARIFLKTFPRKKALILAGPPGTGKTTLALLLAKENNLELFELNASDLRNKSKLEEVLKPVTQQQSLFKKGKLVLMDEAEGITSSDRGGLPELINLIAKSSFPIIITANDIWDKKFSLLRQKCQLVSFKELKEETVTDIIKEILKKENRTVEPGTINLVAKKSRGDVRAALNDIQSILSEGEGRFVSETLSIKEIKGIEITEISEREKQETIFNALKKVFQTPTNENTIKAYDNVDMDMDEIILWVEENIPNEYKGDALLKSFESLSKADIFKGRIYRQQYWRFLVYENFFLTAGISAATKIKYGKFNQYQRPSRILKIWLANQKYMKRKTIVAKYSLLTHMSKKKAMKESFLLPFILDEKSIEKLNLDEKEKEYLKERKAAIIVSAGLNKFRLNQNF